MSWRFIVTWPAISSNRQNVLKPAMIYVLWCRLYNIIMKQTETLVIGAGISGLASAACLKRRGIEYIIIEKQSQIAVPWRNHYERLHLHTNKRLSNLPYKKFGNKIPRYPSRQQVVEYLEDYQKEFNISPVFNMEATNIRRENDSWITETAGETFKSSYLVMATGPFAKPIRPAFEGMENFPGRIMHSSEYKTGRDFKNQKVLVVGFGNSACEIAIDLFEQEAFASMAVRSAVNIIPRDILGIPILEISMVMSRLPTGVADAITNLLMRIIFGDITKLGLKKKAYGPFEEIQKDQHTPVLDIGTLKHIREGHITIYGDIVRMEGKTVYFSDGRYDDFDAVVAATGYTRSYAEIIDVDKSRFEDLKVSVDHQKYFGKDGLYFCGFWIGPTGQIREIGLDGQKIARSIGKKMSQLKS